MKKLFTLAVTIILILTLCSCTASILYNDDAYVDGLYISINKTANRCFVGGYTPTNNNDSRIINIPDEYNGVPVKQLGGYFGRGVPSPFSISLSDYINSSPESEYGGVFTGDPAEYAIDVDYTVENVVFVLSIGKNISSIEYVMMDEYYPYTNEDGSIIFYHPVVTVNCSDENKHFYSKDGKLYNKKTDELIEDFSYGE